MNVDNLELFNRKGEPEKYDKTPKGIEMVPMLLKSIPDGPKDEGRVAEFQKARKELTDEYLMGEYEFVKGIIDDANLPITLTHADFHPRHIIINDETGKITFIDYEGITIRLFVCLITKLTKNAIRCFKPEVISRVDHCWLR